MRIEDRVFPNATELLAAMSLTPETAGEITAIEHSQDFTGDVVFALEDGARFTFVATKGDSFGDLVTEIREMILENAGEAKMVSYGKGDFHPSPIPAVNGGARV